MSSLQSGALGLYISIPFCRSKCTYCNFASGVYPASEHARYVKRLIEDLGASGEWAARMNLDLPRRVDTVYLGGGTPSLLAPELLARLFAAMRAEFDFEPDAEITVECAPGQIADETLEALVGAGVNRGSLGVQSFIDREAATSGRLHGRATVEGDLERLRGAGIANLNVDLIAGLAGQTFASWEESLAFLTPASTCWRWTRIPGWGARCLRTALVTMRAWFPVMMRLRRCMPWPLRSWVRRGWGNMRFRTSAGRGLPRGTTCAIGSGGRIWGWGWMRRRCCGRQAQGRLLKRAGFQVKWAEGIPPGLKAPVILLSLCGG
jgi:hypothetical protein